MIMESMLDNRAALELLTWQIELGATEAIGDAPVNRYELPEKITSSASVAKPAVRQDYPIKTAKTDTVAVARKASESASDLNSLRKAMDTYEYCDIKRGARSLVFADGNPKAQIMIIGEAPGREEDIKGRPFVGKAGQLLDKMLAAIGLDRNSKDIGKAVYISNVIPWRPPRNRDPTNQEIANMLPFMERHVQLANPRVIVLMGNISCMAGLGKRGITRLRGQWTEAYGRPALPMFHPAYLLRNPIAKREAWQDMLELKMKLESLS